MLHCLTQTGTGAYHACTPTITGNVVATGAKEGVLCGASIYTTYTCAICVSSRDSLSY